VFGEARARVETSTGAVGHGGHEMYPSKAGKSKTKGFPGPGAYLHAGGDSRSIFPMLYNQFGSTHPSLKFTSCPGAALDKSSNAGYKRAYWTKGQITKEGLMYLPHLVYNQKGPADLNLSGQVFDGQATAFAPLREPHLRPRDTFGKENRFRREERFGLQRNGIRDLVLPGPGEHIAPVEKAKRFVSNTMMAPADGQLHHSSTFSAARTAFGSTATGISDDPNQRCETPRGRSSWIKGGIVGSKSYAPDVMLQHVTQTKKVVSDMFSDLTRASTFHHTSFNSKCQKNARLPIRKTALEASGLGIDSRGRAKMDRYKPQPPSVTRNVNAMT